MTIPRLPLTTFLAGPGRAWLCGGVSLALGTALLIGGLWLGNFGRQCPPAGAAPPNGAIPAYPAARLVYLQGEQTAAGEILLCQACGPVPCDPCERQINGVDCACNPGCGELRWDAWGPIPWQEFGHGEYVGPARPSHVSEYRIRVDDQLEFNYRLTREPTDQPYRLEVGDTIKIESLIDNTLDREAVVQPDGTITVRMLGQVRAVRRTVPELQADLEEKYKKYYKVTDLTVTPLKVNTRLEDLRLSVNNQFFATSQVRQQKLTPEGTVQLPGVGSVCLQGLTMLEAQQELNARYAEQFPGIEVIPVLVQRAPRFVYVIGEVRAGGRFDMQGPTTAMQAVALAGGWTNGGNLREMVVFRRADDWRLLATRLDLRGALVGKRPNPADEIWLRDSDIVVVPKSSIQRSNDLIELLFTNGLYRAVPFTTSLDWLGGSAL